MQPAAAVSESEETLPAVKVGAAAAVVTEEHEQKSESGSTGANGEIEGAGTEPAMSQSIVISSQQMAAKSTA